MANFASCLAFVAARYDVWGYPACNYDRAALRRSTYATGQKTPLTPFGMLADELTIKFEYESEKEIWKESVNRCAVHPGAL
jgi:hypothetical protein